MAVDEGLVETVVSFVGRGLTNESLSGPCRAAAAALGVDGVAVTLASQLGDRAVVGGSNDTARLLEQIQLTAGEGPCTDATHTGRTVVCQDLDDPAETRWPTVLRQLDDVPVRAVVAIPLTVGRSTIGSLDVTSARPHGLDDLDTAAVHAVGQLMTVAVLAMRARDPADQLGLELSAEVPQATGMVMGALGLTAGDALSRLRGLAFLQGRLLLDVARDVVQGRQSPDLSEPAGATDASGPTGATDASEPPEARGMSDATGSSGTAVEPGDREAS